MRNIIGRLLNGNTKNCDQLSSGVPPISPLLYRNSLIAHRNEDCDAKAPQFTDRVPAVRHYCYAVSTDKRSTILQ